MSKIHDGGLFHKLRHPRRCYVVCAIPRCGSNLLTDGLHATRRAGVPKQFFLAKFESVTGRITDSIQPTICSLRARHRPRENDLKRSLRLKLMSWYLDDFFNPAARSACLRRQPEQAISTYSKCLSASPLCPGSPTPQTTASIINGACTSDRALESAKGKTPLARTAVRPELIEQCLKEGERQEELWQSFFSGSASIFPCRIRKPMRRL